MPMCGKAIFRARLPEAWRQPEPIQPAAWPVLWVSIWEIKQPELLWLRRRTTMRSRMVQVQLRSQQILGFVTAATGTEEISAHPAVRQNPFWDSSAANAVIN